VAIVSSIIFRVVDGTTEAVGDTENIYYGKNGVAWVLRFGGFMALVSLSE